MNRNATTPVFVLIEFPEFVRNQEYLNPQKKPFADVLQSRRS